MQNFQPYFQFRCPNCNRLADVYMELTGDVQTEINCNRCGSCFSANAYDTPDGHNIVLDDYPIIEVRPDPWPLTEDYDWSDQATPSDPYDFFIDSYRQASDMLAEHGSDDGENLINRMIFTQHISALEAFLCDTLVNSIRERPEALKNLLESDKALTSMKFSLTEISNNTNLVNDKVDEYLKYLVYHNLKKSDFLYKKVLGIKILSTQTESRILFEAIQYRHDCVHRNGIGKDKKRLDVFTKLYVQQVADLIYNLVCSIHCGLWFEPINADQSSD